MEKGAVEKEGKKGKPMDDRDHRRQASRSFFRLAAPLCLSALDFRLFHFPLSFRISRTPCSSHLRLHPESAIFVCISWWSWTGNGRPRREKWPPLRFRYGNVLLSFSPPPRYPSTQFPALNSTTDTLVLGEMRFIRPTSMARSTFLLFTTVLSDFDHRPASEPWPFDTTRYVCSWRRANQPFYHSSVSHPVVFDCSNCHSRLPHYYYVRDS